LLVPYTCNMRIGLLSDTHSYLDERILHHLSGCDEIWHAGDIGSMEVADKLEQVAPLRAVYGNIDDHLMRRRFPEELSWNCEGLNIYMIHIGGRPGRYARGVSERVQVCRPAVFVCGHSHLCLVQRDPKKNFIYMNPGAAGTHGFHNVRTLLRFDVSASRMHDLQVIELGPRAIAISESGGSR